MLHHEPQNWIVFWHGERELARISAAEAALYEAWETRELLAAENGCWPEEIAVFVEEG